MLHRESKRKVCSRCMGPPTLLVNNYCATSPPVTQCTSGRTWYKVRRDRKLTNSRNIKQRSKYVCKYAHVTSSRTSVVVNVPWAHLCTEIQELCFDYQGKRGAETILGSVCHTFKIQSRACREAFTALDAESRVGVLGGPLEEIVRMLEQNLLNKFKSRLALERGACVSLSWDCCFFPSTISAACSIASTLGVVRQFFTNNGTISKENLDVGVQRHMQGAHRRFVLPNQLYKPGNQRTFPPPGAAPDGCMYIDYIHST